jgi:hypothetical protein
MVLKKQLIGLRMSINRIFIIGDSFCDFHPNNKLDFEEKSDLHIKWNQWLTWEYPNIEVINDAFVSRDVQTILDNWIKLIPHLKEDDFLILCIPSYFRQRVPLAFKDWQRNEWSGGNITNRFVTHHSWYTTDSEKLYIGDEIVEKNVVDTHMQFFEMLNHSKSVSSNYKELIDSLYKITPSNKYLFSWDDLSPTSDYIDTKTILTNKMEMWTTLDDLYNETNGKYGYKGDLHWDYKTEKQFFKLIKKIIEK